MAVGDPTGEDLASSTRSLSLGNNYTEYSFTLDSTYGITSGVKYAVVLRSPDAVADDGVKWVMDTGVTAGGSLYTSADSGSTWTEYNDGSTYDGYMITKAGGVAKDSLTFLSTSNSQTAYGTTWIAQTFTASSSYTIDVIVVKIKDANPFSDPSEPNDVTVSLRATEQAGHSKTSNPTPANGATEVDFSGYVLDWDGTGDTYDVYMGPSGSLTLIQADVAESTYTTSLAEIESAMGASPIEQKIYWRVDSTLNDQTLTGDEWNFDPRPGKASSPTPSDAGSDIALTQAFSWTLGTNGTTNSLIIGSTTYLSASANVSWTPDADAFTWDEEVTWRVDTTNAFGTTTGDSWTFTALNLDHLRLTYQSIDGGDGPYDGGVEGVDFRWTGLNNVITVKRLVVIAKDRLFYETL